MPTTSRLTPLVPTTPRPKQVLLLMQSQRKPRVEPPSPRDTTPTHRPRPMASKLPPVMVLISMTMARLRSTLEATLFLIPMAHSTVTRAAFQHRIAKSPSPHQVVLMRAMTTPPITPSDSTSAMNASMHCNAKAMQMEPNAMETTP